MDTFISRGKNLRGEAVEVTLEIDDEGNKALTIKNNATGAVVSFDTSVCEGIMHVIDDMVDSLPEEGKQEEGDDF